jgi:hypothetical protein
MGHRRFAVASIAAIVCTTALPAPTGAQRSHRWAPTSTVNRATSTCTPDSWTTPVNLGANVNTAAAETRPSLSADLDRLYFGRLGDIWLSTRAS